MMSPLNSSPALRSRLGGRLPDAILALGVLLFLSPFIGLMFYATPNSDDYAKASLLYPGLIQPAGRTIFGMAWEYYTRASGRWLTTIIQGIAMSKVNLPSVYGWLLLFVMLSNIAGLAYFFSKVLAVSRARALLIGAVFYAIWLSITPFPVEGVFWATEAFEYQFTFSTILLLVGLLTQKRKTSWTYVGLAILAAAIPGQNEVAGAFAVTALLAGWAVARAMQRDARPWLFCFVWAALSLAAIVFSPGVASKFGSGHQVPLTFAYLRPFLGRALRYGLNWAASPQVLLLMTCAVLLLPRPTGLNASLLATPRFRWLALLGVAGMSFLLLEFAGAELASGYTAFGPRAIGWFQFVFWLFLGFVMIVGIPELTQVELSPISKIGVSAILILILLTSTNSRLSRQDLRGPAAQWWASNTARLKQRGRALQFDPLPPKPALFDDTFLSQNANCWVNRAMANYLGADTVVTKGQENSWVQGPACGEKP